MPMKGLVRALQSVRKADAGSDPAAGAARKDALPRALDAVLASQSVELALRAIAREGRALTGADEAMLIVRSSPIGPSDIYTMQRGRSEPEVQRHAIDTFTESIVERAREEAQIRNASDDDPLVRIMLESHEARAMAAIGIAAKHEHATLLLFGREFPAESAQTLETFAYVAAAALNQAHLFMELAKSNDEIAAKKGALDSRQRVIGEIVHALANDLRTPLFAAHLSMQQALSGAFGELPEQYRRVLETALASNADQRRLVETLLLVARLESGEGAARRGEVDLAREAFRELEQMRAVAQARGVSLSVQGDAHACVYADPAELRPAVSSVLLHSVQTTPHGGSVALRVSHEGRDVELCIEDDAAFHQPASNARGAGLTVHLIRLIAESLGGGVSYEARSPRGRRFTMRIPAISPDL
jgi:signal transduction histidine kinase